MSIDNKRKIMVIRSDVETLESMLHMRIVDVKESISNEKTRVEKEMDRGFIQQKSENNRMKNQIEGMRVENSLIQQNTLATQRRIRELEERIGIQDEE